MYLIRHWEQDSGVDQDLTEKGCEQARLTALRLQECGIERIYASPVKRTAHTAQIINQRLTVGLETRKMLHDIDMGDCETRSWEYVRTTYPEFMQAFNARQRDVPYPNGESGKHVWRRSRCVLEEIAICGLERVAVVTHGGIIRVWICGIFGIGQERRFFLGDPLDNCSITFINLHDPASNTFHLHRFNDSSHLF